MTLFHSGSSMTLMSGSKKSSMSGYLVSICSSFSDNRLRIFLKNFTSEYSYFAVSIYCLNCQINDYHLLLN